MHMRNGGMRPTSCSSCRRRQPLLAQPPPLAGFFWLCIAPTPVLHFPNLAAHRNQTIVVYHSTLESIKQPAKPSQPRSPSTSSLSSGRHGAGQAALRR